MKVRERYIMLERKIEVNNPKALEKGKYNINIFIFNTQQENDSLSLGSLVQYWLLVSGSES